MLYALPPFHNSKNFIPNKLASLFGKMTLVQGQGEPTQRSQAFEPSTDWSNNKNHENLQELNKPEPFETPEAPIGPSKTQFPILPTPDIAQYIQKDMDHLF